MNEKRLEFPCTKKCLVYASCKKLCWPYRDYVQESYRMYKYRCFKIIPPPPKQIQELTELLNRIEGNTYKASYYPSDDILIIYEVENDSIASVIGQIRKRKDLYTHPNFPEELK